MELVAEMVVRTYFESQAKSSDIVRKMFTASRNVGVDARSGSKSS
jgi:hypothetical protein